jgi:dihydroxyacid dehydratase/phosphogluconate dehydratase
VRADDILVLKRIGPKGAPGMPEAGYLPIPKKLARSGVKDMVRISDGRMSGTAAGTIVLHVTPEAATGGPLAWVQTGIAFDSTSRRAASRFSCRTRRWRGGDRIAHRGAHRDPRLSQALSRFRDPSGQGRGLRLPASFA